jgi:prepilin peptidase CpaA
MAWLVSVMAFDLTTRRVPNWLIILGALMALAALASSRSPFLLDWPSAFVAGGAAFALFFGFYVAGSMGAGDVKFFGVLGLWLGGLPLVPIAVGASILAGVHAVISLAFRLNAASSRHVTSGAEQSSEARLAPEASAPTRGIPYAAYLAITTLAWAAMAAGVMNR